MNHAQRIAMSCCSVTDTDDNSNGKKCWMQHHSPCARMNPKSNSEHVSQRTYRDDYMTWFSDWSAPLLTSPGGQCVGMLKALAQNSEAGLVWHRFRIVDLRNDGSKDGLCRVLIRGIRLLLSVARCLPFESREVHDRRYD